jgi:hypothetical protein
MATIREQIARHPRSEAMTQQQPQQVADDPLAPVPIRFTHWHDADGVIHQRTVNGPAAGWHLEDDAEGSDAEPSLRPRGQASTPSYQTHDSQQQARVTQAYPPDYEDADEQYTAQARPPRSAMRYQDTRPAQYRGRVVLPTPPQRLRRQRLTGNAPSQQQRSPARRSKPWSLCLVTGMLAMTVLVVGLNSLGSWWQHVQDDWHYGMPRTYQTDAVVGHNYDSSSHPSHFVALNLRGQVEVFELPAGDPTKVRVFLGPTISGDGNDQVVVTISFADLDHDGTPDMIIHYGDSAEVLYNKGGTFQVSGGKSYEQGRSTRS